MSETATPANRHFTTRRGFTIFVGLFVLSLYVLWAAYGAAPTSLSFLTEAEDEGGGGMGGMGGANGGMTTERFSELTFKFVEEFSLPDGSVRPTRRPNAASARVVAANAGEQGQGQGLDEEEEPIVVYLMAMRFSYTPSVLRLKRGVSYRLRMMSMDVNHGASINTGYGGHIMRRPAKAVVDMVMRFPEAGEFMTYCTVYCGEGHSQMKGKIIVE
jgi:cytochrome c oxidase subunit II